MKGTPAIYLGRIVDKKLFRTFVYGPNGEQKLVESWDAFESAMQSGLWFATREDATDSKAIPEPEENEADAKPKSKPKPKPKPKAKVEPVEEADEADDFLPDDGSVFEVTDETQSKVSE